jgi:hypothetical protein
MTSKASKESKLSHGSMSECSVFEDTLYLLDSNRVIYVFVAACLNDN